MFFYFPLKQKNGGVAGRVRIEDGKATFSLTHPSDAEAYLLSGDSVLPIRENEPIPVASAEALIGVENGDVAFFGRAPGSSCSSEQLLYKLSQKRTLLKKTISGSTVSEDEIAEKFAGEEAVQENTSAFLSHNDVPFRSKQASDSDELSPLYVYVRSLFARLEDLRPENDVSAPFSVHNVDNSVDESSRLSIDMVQKEDVFASASLNAPFSVPDAAAETTDAPPTNEPFAQAAATDDADASVSEHAQLLQWERDDSFLPKIDLFPTIFPNARWRFVARDGVPPHYEGIWSHNGERIRILAVRGAYDTQPPKGLSGFTRFLRADGAGYWVRLLPIGRG